MGEVIQKSAAVEDILADLRTTYDRAKARNGVFAELADQRLASAIALIEPIEREVADLRASSGALIAALDAADHEADAVVGDYADRIWNAIGRPARDAGYDVLFPGGNAYYVNGDVAEQPERMRLLVGVLRRYAHPRLDRAVATEAADAIERAAAKLGAAVDAARAPRTLLQLLERTRTALARTTAIELADFKRFLKASGMSEAEVHTVIPDRPRSRPGLAKSNEPKKPA